MRTVATTRKDQALTIHHALQERPEEERRSVVDSRHPERRGRWKAFAGVVEEREAMRCPNRQRIFVFLSNSVNRLDRLGSVAFGFRLTNRWSETGPGRQVLERERTLQ